MSSRRRRSARRGFAGAALFALLGVVLLVVAVVAVIDALSRSGGSRPVTASCAAALNGTRWTMSPVQADNAALVTAVAERRGLPAHAATIALATALQESKLVNITSGDLDSLGLFQQRPSQGWGTAQQIMDPLYATGQFYDRLVTIPGYQDLPVTQAAQQVQRSAYPDAYAQHETQARAWASALTGFSPAALTCTLHAPAAAGSSESFTARVTRDLGQLPVTVSPTSGQTPAPTTVVDARSLGGAGAAADDTRGGWAFAQWAVAVADSQQVTSVRIADQVWSRSRPAWAKSGSPALAAGSVEVTLAAG